jgi:hypothetical protein
MSNEGKPRRDGLRPRQPKIQEDLKENEPEKGHSREHRKRPAQEPGSGEEENDHPNKDGCDVLPLPKKRYVDVDVGFGARAVRNGNEPTVYYMNPTKGSKSETLHYKKGRYDFEGALDFDVLEKIVACGLQNLKYGVVYESSKHSIMFPHPTAIKLDSALGASQYHKLEDVSEEWVSDGQHFLTVTAVDKV